MRQAGKEEHSYSYHYSRAILSFVLCSAILVDLMANYGVGGAGVFIVDQSQNRE